MKPNIRFMIYCDSYIIAHGVRYLDNELCIVVFYGFGLNERERSCLFYNGYTELYAFRRTC